jgi:hypothetical protein
VPVSRPAPSRAETRRPEYRRRPACHPGYERTRRKPDTRLSHPSLAGFGHADDGPATTEAPLRGDAADARTYNRAVAELLNNLRGDLKEFR